MRLAGALSLICLQTLACQAARSSDAGPEQDAGPRCVFDGGVSAVGDPNPSNPCQVCATSGWFPVGDGLPCGPTHACRRGRCEPQCLIDGGAYTAGQKNPDNFGECCNPALDAGVWQPYFSPGPFLLTGPEFTLGELSSLAAEDFNRDGRMDLVVLVQTNAGFSVAVVLNDGAFANPTVDMYALPPGAAPTAFTAFDLDGDGAPEVLVADQTNALELMRNRGNGTFNPPVAVPLSQSGTGVVVVPGLLAPGRLTVVVTTAAQELDAGGTVVLFDVDTDGGLSLVEHTHQTTDPGPWSPALLPLSSPASPSVVFETVTPMFNGVEVLSINGDAVPLASPLTPVGSINGLAVGDLTGDGLADLIASNFFEKTIGVAVGDGAGGFAAWVPIPIPARPNGAPMLADFDGSGRPAIAVALGWSIELLWPLPDGGMVAVVGSTGRLGDTTSYGNQLLARDFNGDGALDLLVSYENNGYQIQTMQLLFNNCP